jgi:cobalt-zinc-cadmium efflux system protein
MRLAARPARGAWTFGWKRAEIISAAGNGITLLVVSGLVGFEAIRRLISPPTVEAGRY